MADVNYFNCTLGHALQRKQLGLEPPASAANIIDLLSQQSRSVPQAPALGFANFKSTGSSKHVPPDVVTFKELHDLSVSAAHQLSRFIEPPAVDASEPAVALLCRSSMDFVLTWLGLMRRGYATLLLA
jgi:acyl-CoA synthetase (AMP-forming)/AMP-acid ligase II